MDGLDQQAVAQLAESAGRVLTPADCASIVARTGGNPLFLKELLARGDLKVTNDRTWSTLVDAVRYRVDQLDPMAFSFLSAAALFRKAFHLDSLAIACGLDTKAASALMKLCVRGGVLVDADPMAGSYRFRHSLIAEVLASQQLAVDRSAAHRSIGHHLIAIGLSLIHI